jgi:hypothetical protein
MKVILSRKGFDSSAGGHPSPILPDGAMLSLPIPSSRDSLSYDEIAAPGGRSFSNVLTELGGKAKVGKKGAHLDPDLVRGARPRRKGWRPSLGQIGSASGHLRNQRVEPGDLFLFYGWFLPTDVILGKLRFRSSADSFHAIFGYLQVGEIIRTAEGDGVPNWLSDHPHASEHRARKRTNVFYVAAPRLSWDAAMPGAGTFRLRSELVLSKQGMSRFKDAEISYHTKEAWRDGYFKSYPRAQEYVIAPNTKVATWARALIALAFK